MQEAIDYNALSWVRQELAETLKQARHYLEEYAGSKSRESLQGCVAHLHEARGPLQMVNLKGADLLTGEMEEVLADLLLDSVDQPETALELLMQGFLEIPEYLYSLRAGRPDKLDVLFPLVNSLRATRGEQPLEEDAVFSPDLSVRVPVTVFDMRAEHAQQDVAALARAARSRFQGGLLDWYRNGASGNGLQMLVDTLNHLQQNAGSEPVARLWWVAAGVAELLQEGALEVTPGIKRLFGQIDRHIKRLMEQGEAVFSDVLTDDLLKNLLYQVYKSEGGSARIASIRSTYGLGISADESAFADSSDGLPTCSEELLQTVSGTVREDIGRIKEQLDEFLKSDRTGTEVLATVADELHALGNMLDMIGMDRLGEIVAGEEQLLRGCAEGVHQASEGDFSEMANTMVAIEDALADISASIDSQQSGGDSDDVTFRQGRDAVIGAVMDDMASAKESINEFLRSCGDFELLADVPVILNRIHGGLQMADQDRLAIVTSMVRTFIARELVTGHRELSEEDLDTLADAICSIEYCVEELVENRDYGHRAMQIAEDSIEKLGYACPEIEPQEEVIEAGQESVASAADDATGQSPADNTTDATLVSAAAGGVDNEVTSLQVINSEGDPEIIEIFNEEAAEELEKVTGLIPAWCDDPSDQDALTEIRRSLHTLKGSGRMVGAMATGEFSWAMEHLVNNLLDGNVDVSAGVVDLLRQVPAALSALIGQVREPGLVLPGDIDDLARQAHAFSKPDAAAHVPADIPALAGAGASVSPADGPENVSESVLVKTVAGPTEAAPGVEQMPVVVAENFPVLGDDADQEIVDIFLEEATEEFNKISVSIPAWITQPENTDLIAELQRSFHTMKGSGRMAGAMRIGEFCWIVELVFTRLTDGVIQQSASMFRFMGRVPEVLSQMLDQIRTGQAPAVDVQEMMEQAAQLANGGQVAVSSAAPQDATVAAAAAHDMHGEGPSLVGEAAGPAAAAPGVEQMPVVVAENFPVLGDDADQEIVDIFLEEATEEFNKISVSIPAWITQPENTDLIAELQRSFHTMKGSGRMAGAMRIGEFCWIVELVFTRLTDGVIQQSASMFRFMGRVPEVLSQMLDQIRTGQAPAVDVQEMMEQAAQLANGGQVAVSSAAPQDTAGAAAAAHDMHGEGPSLVGEAAGPAAAAPGIEQMPVVVAENFPVLGDDADQEIVDIFLEEATEEFNKISVSIPAWITQPENTDLIAELQRSFHTMKGSGRMAGAMRIGEFCWIVELVFTRLTDGVIQQSASMFRFMGRVPEVLSQMLDQIRTGQAPAVDVQEMMEQAAQLANGGQVAVSSAAPQDAAVAAASAHDMHGEGPSLVGEAAGPAAAAPGVEQMPVVVAENFPVLGDDADQEIVDIFLEEATDEFNKISVSIPAWITQPENTDLIAELQRSFHTMKGSGRMAGAMRIGEFCWIVELVFTRLTDGVIQQSASMFRFMGRVPEVLSQMLDQIRTGQAPAVDVQEMMEQAAQLANGGQVAVSSAAPQDTAGAAAAAHDMDDDETSLIEIFTNECREHLQVLDEWVELFEAPGHVSDSLYRALHTLSGISESAEMTAISRLADGLYTWFGALYEEQKAVGNIGYEVLRDCAIEITRMVNALPGTVSNEVVLDVLCTRIGALSPVEHQPPAVIMPESVGETVSGRVEDVEAMIVPPVDFSDTAMAAEPVAEELSFTDDRIAEVVEADAFEEPVDDAVPPDEHLDELPANLVAGAEIEEDAGPEDSGETVCVSDASGATPADDETQVDVSIETADEPAPALQHVSYEDIDPALYEIFVEEATEIMDASEATLRGWSDEPDNRDLMTELQRQLHTLKGSARMVDLTPIGNLSHAVESVMTEIAENRVPCTPELFGMLADSHDRLADMLDQARNRQPIMFATGLEARLQAIISGGEVAGTIPESTAEAVSATGPEVEETTPAVIEGDDSVHVDVQPEAQAVAEEEGPGTEPAPAVGEAAHVDEQPEAEAVAEEPAQVQVEEPAEEPPAPVRPRGRNVTPPRLVIDREQQTKARGEQVKVQSDTLDNMVNHAGEINIFRARMEKQISDYRFNLAELDQTISRLRDQLRKLEMETEAQILNRHEQESDQRNQDFDPLEMDRYSNLQQLSRSLMESISDLRSLQELMESTTRDSETLLLQQSRVSTELQENLIRTRMIPFVSLSPRLRRIARQSARQLDKKVEVNLLGEDGEMDRAVLERIVAPLEHMLRNSVAHGIELPRVRKESGKPVSGRIDIGFERDGGEIVLSIADDGAGMNIDAIRSRAIERELIPEGSNLPDDDVIQFVLQTGFSTASEVTQISGRGVGLDVVNSEVKQLGGSLHIESEAGKGTIFTVRLPYTLAINQGMLVTAGDETFCVPLASVEGVVRFYPEEIRDCYSDGHQLFEYGGNEYSLKHLGSLLETGGMSLPGEREQVPVLLIRAGEKRIGFHVESLQGIREVVIKPVGPQLSLVDSISGATILGDGRVVMILDMVAVSRREASVQTASGAASSAQRDSKLVVMVVDDSITVRKVTTRLLERNGYKVVTAKDGVDAMGMLQESVPDIMLLDIEMPRMDGFELATHMRNDDTLRHVPIIMITSRTGDKHRERARQIGVQHYLGKPYQESDLLDSIHEIIGVTQAVSAT